MSRRSTASDSTLQSEPRSTRKTPQRSRCLSLKAVENLMTSSTDELDDDISPVVISASDSVEATTSSQQLPRRRSTRKISPNKRYYEDFALEVTPKKQRKSTSKHGITEKSPDDNSTENDSQNEEDELNEPISRPELQFLQQEHDVAGRNMFGFNTPKKRNAMALAALNTPKTPKTPKTSHSHGKTPDALKRRKSTTEAKTPSHLRHRVRNQISKLVVNSDSDFSGDESEFHPSDSGSSVDTDDSDSSDAADNVGDDEPQTPRRGRRAIVVPILPKTPSAARLRQSARVKKSTDYIPESENYFHSHSSGKVLTSDHTLDRLKNPRLPADRLFSLLADMKLSAEHEEAISAITEEYRSYFPKWMCILNEGFNLLLYGLGSKRQLLQSFHREVLSQQTVLVVNGFFPSLTIKDVLDNITGDILDAGPSPPNSHEAVDMIEEEFSLIPETHLYLIVHNLDGVMLRNGRAQSILARLASVPNIHLLASIDHINTPLLWDQAKLSNFNFSWWDCTTMLPYTDETAYENSLMVQNSGELALSSMRSVFSSLTANARGIYMLIVKYQLKNKTNQNYQGMPFKELYSSCREAFLVSSDLTLRAQLTEFLDHKLVKSKRSLDGSEQLTIPINSQLLEQFLEEQQKK